MDLTAIDDDEPEGTQYLYVDILSYPAPGQGAVPYTIGSNHAEVAIKDPPVVSIGNAGVTEGDTGNVVANLTVSLSFAIEQSLTVNYVTVDGTATPADNDYVQVGSGAVVIPAGSTSVPHQVQVKGNDRQEPNEQFQVALTSASVAAVNFGAQWTGTVTINNDDYAPVITNAVARTDREGTTISWQVTATDQDTSASGLTFVASGLPLGLSMSASGLVTGKIKFSEAGNHSVTVTATDSGVNQGTATFTWTITDAAVSQLTG